MVTMAASLAPGFYREKCGEVGVFYVDESRTLWLVFTGDDADLPWRMDDEMAIGIEPFPDIRQDRADEYRRMVDEAKTWRQKPPLV
jgi:hypothetical protein